MKLKGKELKEQMNSDLFDGSVGHLARFTNRISTHCGVEMIYPFVENVEWANIINSLPSDILFQGGRSKALLRESFKNELPHEIYSRKDKMGLPSPNNEWIEEHKDHWIQYFTDELSDIYDLDYLKSFYNKWWSIKGRSENYRHFRHISYAIWHKVWMKERRYPKSKS